MVCYLKKHCHTQSHLGFLLLSSRSFVVLSFMFRSVIHSEIISMKVVSSVSRFLFLFLMWLPVIPAQFVEKTVFAPLCCLCSFVKDQWSLFWSVSGLCCVTVICLFGLSPMPHYLDCCSFILILKSDSVCVVFLAFLGLLTLHIPSIFKV